MGAVADLAVRREFAETKRAGGGQAGVRKQNQTAILQVENLLRLQLKTDQAFMFRPSRMIELFNQQRAECIITPAGVAISEHQYVAVHYYRLFAKGGNWFHHEGHKSA